MKDNPKYKDIWKVIFMVIPAVIFMNLSDLFTSDRFLKILYSGLFGLIGVIFGLLVLYFVKNSSRTVKIIATLILTIISISTIFVVGKILIPTCEVCGYKAVNTDTQECMACGSTTWEKEKNYGVYSDKYKWLSDEQLFWFAMDSLNQDIDFYKPEKEGNYYKDKSWKPIITGKDLWEDLYERTHKNKE